MADWYGVELDQPLGRHDGTVQGVSVTIFRFGIDAFLYKGEVFCSGKGSWSICDTEQADQAGRWREYCRGGGLWCLTLWKHPLQVGFSSCKKLRAWKAKLQEQSGSNGINPGSHSCHTGAKVALSSPPRESSCKCCPLDDRQPLQQVYSSRQYETEVGFSYKRESTRLFSW